MNFEGEEKTNRKHQLRSNKKKQQLGSYEAKSFNG